MFLDCHYVHHVPEKSRGVVYMVQHLYLLCKDTSNTSTVTSTAYMSGRNIFGSQWRMCAMFAWALSRSIHCFIYNRGHILLA